jgi:hypothetical protein
VESDPIGLRGGLNTFGYVYQNPLTQSDQYGLEANPICVAACATAGSVAGGYVGNVLGGVLGGAGGTLVLPVGGTISGGVAGAASGGAIGAIGGGLAGNAAGQAFCPDDKNNCTMASAFQIASAGITDAHEFKEDYVGGSISRYDICACDDGSIKIAGRGQCSKSGAPMIDTWARWK